jgi:hypothetical protein
MEVSIDIPAMPHQGSEPTALVGQLITSAPGQQLYSAMESASSGTGSPMSHSGQVTGNRRRRGRPATALALWEQPHMQRRLVRLYCYTSAKSMSTARIGKLISALAQLEAARTAGYGLNPPTFNRISEFQIANGE